MEKFFSKNQIICRTCNQNYKTYEGNFYKQSANKTGYAGKCIKCCGEYQKKYSKGYRYRKVVRGSLKLVDDDLCELYLNNSLDKLSAMFGISTSTIKKRLVKQLEINANKSKEITNIDKPNQIDGLNHENHFGAWMESDIRRYGRSKQKTVKNKEYEQLVATILNQ